MMVESILVVLDKSQHLQISVTSASESKFGVGDDLTVFYLVGETLQQDTFGRLSKNGSSACRSWLSQLVDDCTSGYFHHDGKWHRWRMTLNTLVAVTMACLDRFFKSRVGILSTPEVFLGW